MSEPQLHRFCNPWQSLADGGSIAATTARPPAQSAAPSSFLLGAAVTMITIDHRHS